MNSSFDIVIIGAGPAGCCAALALRNSKHRVALFEKHSHPREKICGDGICDRSINTLKTLSELYYQEFLNLKPKQQIANTALHYKNKQYILNFNNFGYTCKRIHFDTFLYSLVTRDCINMSIFENTSIQTVEKSETGYTLTDNFGKTYTTKILIVANGAKSNIAETISGNKFNKSNHGVAIRAYYSGVKQMDLHSIELHYKKEYFPGYLWIFPLSETEANVGFGYHLQQKVAHTERIQDILQKWITEDKTLQTRFADAQATSSFQGGLIPYNTNSFNCSGAHYMICGDAASLIDPISGGGIGSAMLSGYFAAIEAETCCDKQNFSAEQTKEYENKLRKRIEREIKTRNTLQKTIAKHTWMLDVLACVGKNAKLLSKIKSWYMK